MPVPAESALGSEKPSLRAGAVRMLQGLATMSGHLTRAQVGMLAGMSTKSGSFTTYLSNLRRAGFINDIDAGIYITDAGLKFLNGDFGDTPRTTQAVANLFRKSLRAGAWRMLGILIADPRRQFTRAELAEAAGIAPTSGSFTTYLSNIRNTGLVATTRQHVRIAEAMLELL